MESLLKKAKKHCLELLNSSRCSSLPFHNEKHTTEVYKNAKKIADYQELPNDQLVPLLVAALYHDTGNALSFVEHENLSASNAILFLEKENKPKTFISSVVGCINATKLPQNPHNIMERIICDADLFHLGTENFLEKNEQLRKEWHLVLDTEYSDVQWYEMNIDFLKKHTYFTAYGRKFLEPIKQKNCAQLQSKLRKPEKI